MKEIVIILEGGLVQNVLSEEPMDVTVVNYDTDDVDSTEVGTVLGEDACLRGFISEVNPDDFNAILNPNLSDEEELSLIKDNVKVEWVESGEGWNGDYNPEDPDDTELLRFDVSILVDGEWVEKEDASYCTRFPVNATKEEKLKGLKILLDEYHNALSGDTDVSVKGLGERMSWIGRDSIKPRNTETNNSPITLTEEEKNTLMMKLAKLSSGETTEAHSGQEQEHLKSIFKKLF